MPRTMVNITDDEIGAESSALDNDQHLFALWAVPEGERPVMVFGVIATAEQLRQTANAMLRHIGYLPFLYRPKEMPHDGPFPEFEPLEGSAAPDTQIHDNAALRGQADGMVAVPQESGAFLLGSREGSRPAEIRAATDAAAQEERNDETTATVSAEIQEG